MSNDKSKGLPVPGESKSKLMSMIAEDHAKQKEVAVEVAPVVEVKEEPKTSSSKLTVMATRAGFYKGSRIAPGQRFKLASEQEFSKHWMKHI